MCMDILNSCYFSSSWSAMADYKVMENELAGCIDGVSSVLGEGHQAPRAKMTNCTSMM